MKSTQATDALLQKILDAVSTGGEVTVEDAASFEQVLWEYKGCREDRKDRKDKKVEKSKDNKDISIKLARDLGLRDGNAVRNVDSDIPAITSKEISQIDLCLRTQKALPQEIGGKFKVALRAYLDKKISIATLFGEMDRQPRNGHSWQATETMKQLADYALEHIRLVSGKELHTSNGKIVDPGSLYSLMVDISENAITISENAKTIGDIVTFHRLDKDAGAVVSKLRATIALESPHIPRTFLLKPSSWRDAYKKPQD